MSKHIYIIHENDEWVAPLRIELEKRNLPYKEWFLGEGQFDLQKAPPNGIFYNRMSASSHTRGHRYAPEHTAGVLSWLESYDRIVLNDSRALKLEISKIAQHAAFKKYGIKTPYTIATLGKEHLLDAAKTFPLPFITKHNRAGKGLGVHLFHSYEALEKYVLGDEFEDPVDGITLIQEYIQAPESFITRVEFVGQEFLYAVKVNTSAGFELCPADSCAVGDQFCPTIQKPENMFEIIKDFDHPILEQYKKVLRENGIHVAGIEFIVDKNGQIYTYDLNTNTNYNSKAEKLDYMERSGMSCLADFLGKSLHNLA